MVGTELDYMQSAMGSGKLCGMAVLPVAASSGWSNVLAAPSVTDAVLHRFAGDGGAAARYQPGDEVIMPSYTFVSTANALCCVAQKSFLWMFARTP